MTNMTEGGAAVHDQMQRWDVDYAAEPLVGVGPRERVTLAAPGGRFPLAVAVTAVETATAPDAATVIMIGDLDLDTIRERLGGDARAQLDAMIAEKRVIVVNEDTLNVQSAAEYLTEDELPAFTLAVQSVAEYLPLPDLTAPARTVVFPEVRPSRQARRAAERQQRKHKGAGVG
ncbi:hypothetical protein [Deinococcus aquaticus]|uniref:hypothetical protein n=1 Tax=Deinococcus aquaticus TaxID=328692 RepID=UPI003F4665CC